MPDSNLSPAAVLIVLAAGCGHAGPPGRAASDAREALAPHLRVPADGTASVRHPEHSDPLPNPAAGVEVSLGGLLAFADARSPALAVARSTRSAAAAERVGAELLLPANPELSIAVGPRSTGAGTGIDVEATLMQQIEIAGERGLRIEAADRRRELTDAEVEDLRWAVHCDVHAAFHAALVQQERERLAQRVASFQREVLRVVEQQVAAGETAPLSLRLAQAEVAQAEQAMVGAQQGLLASRLRLAQLSGWPVATPPTPRGLVDKPREPPPVQTLLAIARQQLPSLRAGMARKRAAEARAAVADREAWVRPSVGVQYSREDDRGGVGPTEIVMGLLSIPIPSFQLNQGERARARADVTVAAAELDAATLLLAGQIAEARSEVAAAAARTHAYGSEILPRFEENLTMLRRAFELGEIDILALSTGRERFLRIQSDALSAQQDYFIALAGLERVVGVELWRDDHHEEKQP